MTKLCRMFEVDGIMLWNSCQIGIPKHRDCHKNMLDGQPPEDLCLGQVLAFLCCISALQYAPREKWYRLDDGRRQVYTVALVLHGLRRETWKRKHWAVTSKLAARCCRQSSKEG
ncbi:hypothetical protein NC653_025080 [Populus alba x Populus x berolinensis]|uniref:Uncharacterized protein n=1 Tax=Populus alba x Populus x berolinensis TaxID=444605 RepID=A0AAD6MAX1_9ROSI|nr:hypothetical protein NC653_025080 [Populus alba x Populus x berolinensis]